MKSYGLSLEGNFVFENESGWDKFGVLGKVLISDGGLSQSIRAVWLTKLFHILRKM